MVFCSKCGEKMPDSANFCLKCGVRTAKGIEDGVPIPQDWLAHIGQELEKAFETAATEVEKALKTARNKIQESRDTQVGCPHCGETSHRDAKYCYS